MFTHAVRTANRFTFPYVGLRRRRCGQVNSSIGAFVVINADGWILTSAHIVQEILATESESNSAEASGTDASPESCVRHAEIWAVPGFFGSSPRMAEAIVRPVADLALARLENVDPALLTGLPILRDPEEHPIDQGVSVCRLGYPFHNISAEFDEATGEFQLPQEAFPVPSFALDGVVSRFHRVNAETENGPESATFIETSTPGLRGQSGGPLFDVEGRVCGIQSHTVHLDLGFDARYGVGESVVTERQFLNVGAATHIADVIAMLAEANVSYEAG